MNKKGFETIRCDQDGPILRLTFNRPELLNSINGRMLGNHHR
jgi:enoyl-CoA hydratase/carnithine racemase